MLFILYQVSPLKSSRSSNKSPVDLASKKGCERRNDCALSIQVEPSALPLSGSPVTSSAAPSVLFSKPTVGNANNGFPSLISSSEPGEESVNWSAYVSNIAQWIFSNLGKIPLCIGVKFCMSATGALQNLRLRDSKCFHSTKCTWTLPIRKSWHAKKRRLGGKL